jgi:hypothetical protein
MKILWEIIGEGGYGIYSMTPCMLLCDGWLKWGRSFAAPRGPALPAPFEDIFGEYILLLFLGDYGYEDNYEDNYGCNWGM